ncbi:Methyltransferase domain-containing protein [Thermomonospora echinospora]|uniref:Methyltransferase domain-containing protein n=1 Tax=Thermomonospora echinospora TaxID=1992 RepID=A0A1H6DNQ1_9ACTN|nr:class I SAM-dependent methyltransferase [Thermomonospora echinospora]SEG86403.1 Methyltransferase domain-containing protein [Thermomonospora echinospora]
MTTTEADRADQGLGYAVNAPYYDLIFPEQVRDFLAAALRLLPEDARAVAEIGPGTGQFTEILAGMLGPEAEIFAIEPARVMRAALVTRLARLPEAARKVTVLLEDALTAQMDVPLDGVVLFNLIMHFSPADRPALWKKWAEALRPGGVLLVESQFPQTAVAVPPSVVPGRSLGRHRYETLSRAETVGEDLIRWVMTYRTLRGDVVMREETAEFDCHVVSDETLAAELTAAGLEPHPDAPEGVQVWRRPR